jgi:hypothetical protein
MSGYCPDCGNVQCICAEVARTVTLTRKEPDSEIIRDELARRHDENERLTRCANKIGRMVIQRNEALKLAREIEGRLAVENVPWLRNDLQCLVRILEGK